MRLCQAVQAQLQETLDRASIRAYIACELHPDKLSSVAERKYDRGERGRKARELSTEQPLTAARTTMLQHRGHRHGLSVKYGSSSSPYCAVRAQCRRRTTASSALNPTSSPCLVEPAATATTTTMRADREQHKWQCHNGPTQSFLHLHATCSSLFVALYFVPHTRVACFTISITMVHHCSPPPVALSVLLSPR